ncbi:glutaminase A [Bacillus salitolerans]|uniref:Glutaminase n=1 Tax=Bacillus salitolerans TaxID=1437434 RepID=A0ABW4LNM3_9BACI
MLCQSSTELMELVTLVKPYTKQGKVANYIPALGRANPSDLSISVFNIHSSKCQSAGDISVRFTLQSISKVITLALALVDHDEEYVFNKVGMEPTGDPFNSIIKLEMLSPSKPLNPMINAGALVVTSMIKGGTVQEKLERIMSFVRKLSGNNDISYSEEVAISEYNTGSLNRALCYYMKQHNVLDANVEELMELYTKQCSIETTCFDLAQIGAVMANNGTCPITGERFIPIEIAKICKTFMVTCGMYNASGEFAIRVGIPAKSGVSGGILGIVPNEAGIGVYSPSLDEKGNSVAGLKLLEILSKKHNFSMF